MRSRPPFADGVEARMAGMNTPHVCIRGLFHVDPGEGGARGERLRGVLWCVVHHGWTWRWVSASPRSDGHGVLRPLAGTWCGRCVEKFITGGCSCRRGFHVEHEEASASGVSEGHGLLAPTPPWVPRGTRRLGACAGVERRVRAPCRIPSLVPRGTRRFGACAGVERRGRAPCRIPSSVPRGTRRRDACAGDVARRVQMPRLSPPLVPRGTRCGGHARLSGVFAQAFIGSTWNAKARCMR